MSCNCNNNGIDGAISAPEIKHVFGNVLKLAIPLTLREITVENGEVEYTDSDFVPSSEHPVIVLFSKGAVNINISAEMHDGNVAYIEEYGKIPIGVYAITVMCYDVQGNPYRFKQNMVLQVVDTTIEAGITTPIEYETQVWYLNAALYIALKGEDGVGIEDIVTESSDEIGGTNYITFVLTDGRTRTFTILNGSGVVDQEFNINSPQPISNSIVTTKFNEIDTKLDNVFGDVEYNSSSKTIRFFAKGKPKTNENVLASIDARPFVKDGMVSSVYISGTTLVITFNTDSGREPIGVPLQGIFNPNNYYTRSQTDSRISQAVSDVTSSMNNFMGKSEYTNSQFEGSPSNGIIKYEKSARVTLDFIEDINGMHVTDVLNIFGAADGHIYRDAYGHQLDLGSAAGHIFLNKDDGLLYAYEDDEWVQVVGSGSGVDVDSTWVENSTNPVESQLVKSELDSLSASIEDLDAQLNPYTLSLSASSALLEYTGSAQNVTFTPTMKRGSTTITPDSVSVTCNSTTKTSSPYTFSLTNRNSYTANATATKDGTTKTASASVKVMHRMRIGFATGYSAILADSNTKQNLKNSVSGTYTATNGNADNYLWICVDATLSVSTVKSSGFDVPMETAVTTDGYKCYMSSEKIATGEMTIEIY